jgi:hypothetical protein
MKRAGKIGRLGRAAIVAAIGVGSVLLAIPVANAEVTWEMVNDRPAQTVTKIKQPVTTLEPTWE